MLRCSKPAKPTMRTTGSRSARNVRCLSAKAMTAFMRRLAGCGSVSSPRLCRAVYEQAAARHDSLSRLEAVQNLDHAVVDTACVNGSESKAVASLPPPDPGHVTLAHHGLLGNRQRIGRTTGNDAEACKHLWLQLAVRVVNRRADRDAVGHRIDRRAHGSQLRVEEFS